MSAFIGSEISRTKSSRCASNHSRRVFFFRARRKESACGRNPRNDCIGRPSAPGEAAAPRLGGAELPCEHVHCLLRVASGRHEQVEQQRFARGNGVHGEVSEVEQQEHNESVARERGGTGGGGWGGGCG